MVPADIDLNMAELESTPATSTRINKLKCNWKLWSHLPQDAKWDLPSYKAISSLRSVQEVIAVIESLTDDIIKNCMLFIMKDGINPMWEDVKNRNGGCFSYKVTNKSVVEVWRDLTYILTGNTISADVNFVNNVTGITISPKKNFCIVKIWMTNCDYQNPSVVTEIRNLISQGCLFKKHTPEY